MSVELEILLAGDVPGLNEHRLSIRHFGDALRELESAVRSIGSSILANAMDDPDYGSRGGRRAIEANALDLEICEVGEGSLRLGFVCAMLAIGQQQPLLPALAEQTIDEVLHAIDEESNQRPRNAKIRKFLSRMPAGLTRQTFIFRMNGEERRRVEIQHFTPVEFSGPLPSLSALSGQIAGVTFEPAKNEVLIKGESSTIRCGATPALVDTALALRGNEVHALVVHDGKSHRLLRLSRDPWERRVAADPRATGLFTRWATLLERLA
jgi:hypothetical protein